MNFVYENISPYEKKISAASRIKEKTIRIFFFINALTAVILLLLIFLFLLNEVLEGFSKINISEFFYTQRINDAGEYVSVFEWYPTSDNPRYSIIPLIVGTLSTALPAVIIASVFGIAIGIYLSELASHKTREIIKPVIELFAGIPTVVLGFFILVVGAGLFQSIFGNTSRLNAFLAALGLAVIIIPIISSLTEEALRAVPNEMRMASYALGAGKWQTIFKVILPAAVNGLSAGIILGFGRAVGETMIVLMASGNAAQITFDIFRSARTMTATIAAELGEVSYESSHYFALFFIGTSLFVVTFLLNLTADLILTGLKRKLRSK